jgi:outer membrane protein OmpA-like peptidoglycan-associated protein
MSLSAVFGREGGREDESGHWMSVSDLMSGLMIVFLFIAVVFMRHVAIERDKIKEVAVTYQANQTEIWRALEEEFAGDLERWNARIDGSTLEVRFQNPDVLFEPGIPSGSRRLLPSLSQGARPIPRVDR